MLMLSTVKTVVRFFNSHVWPAIAGAFVLFFLAPESILTMIIMSHYESKKSCAALRGAQR